MRVQEAMARLPRVDFLPRWVRGEAAADAPLPLGHGATCSQPSTVATMLRLLDVQPGHRVLDIGCGSGGTTALLHELCSPGGDVVGVELVTQLATQARANLAGVGLADIAVHAARPGVLGWPPGLPYDRILVSAAAEELPDELVEQLAVPGRMVIPVARTLQLVTRSEDGVGSEHCGSYRFVPLR